MQTFLRTFALFLVLSACGGSDPAPEQAPESGAAALPEGFWSPSPLAEPRDVLELRQESTDGQPVVLRGTVQEFGSLATFKLVEDSLPDCAENAGDTCATPWDFCCADPTELQQGTVNVEFLDGEAPGPWNVRGFHGIDHLSEVVVAGTLRKDEAGNLRLEAQKIAVQ